MKRILKNARCKGCYVVDVDSHMLFGRSGMLHLDPIRGMTISGTIRHAPLFSPGHTGEKIWFQWNALLEPEIFDSSNAFIIDSEFIYKAGDVYMNRNVWVRLDEVIEFNAFIGHDESVHRYKGVVVGAPRFSFLQKGDEVVFDQRMAHRIMAAEYADHQISCVKSEDILLYR
jgi:hypothetical protein